MSLLFPWNFCLETFQIFHVCTLILDKLFILFLLHLNPPSGGTSSKQISSHLSSAKIIILPNFSIFGSLLHHVFIFFDQSSSCFFFKYGIEMKLSSWLTNTSFYQNSKNDLCPRSFGQNELKIINWSLYVTVCRKMCLWIYSCLIYSRISSYFLPQKNSSSFFY